ncbi:TPA: hypothetical protein DEP96_00070 [Candidatus Uhrbacteria bacterium]|nr:hypothetical protein [Candidatus Uhrbacteria bacterium]
MFEPFPFFLISDKNPKDGLFIKQPGFCIKHFKDKTERIFFDHIILVRGWHISPSGFSCYVDENKVIFGIRIIGRFDREKTKRKLQVTDFNPILTEDHFYSILNEFNIVSRLNEHVEFNNQTIHEIRKLNQTIKSNSEFAQEKITNREGIENIENHVKRIFSASSLITTRLNIVDLNQNPELLGEKSDIGIYNKFYKAARCLESHEKRVAINLHGESHKTINSYRHFEILPVVLLENAVKYSPPDQVITVIFSEQADELEISIESIGPFVLPEERELIFLKSIRGSHALKTNEKGSGIGLYFAKLICDQHSIIISAESNISRSFDYNNVKYAPFTLILRFVW